MINSLTYDVVIMGSGVAGCATAIALKNLNSKLKIAILERGNSVIETNRIGETLPPQASKVLQQLGIWDDFATYNFITSYGTSAAWGSSQLYTNEYIYSPYGYGWYLDRPVFDGFMLNEAKKRGVDFFFETSCIASKKEAHNWVLDCNSNRIQQIINADFVVDATGKKAAFSVQQGAEKIATDQLVGIYRFYDLKNKKKTGGKITKGSLVETNEHGWWYSAVLPNDVLVAAYMTDADIAVALQMKNAVVFEDFLSQTIHTGSRVDGKNEITKPKIIAAHSQCLNTATGDLWLAVGDAASCYDPISAAGIFKSLAMSNYAAYAVLDTINDQPSGLKKYQKIIDHDFQGYLKKHQEYYNQEERFASSPFWNRRNKIH
ncbi:NAD(P)/FAD-dependent oxidoreductase [Flavobacterium sp.]|uniref:NAD(P)/FAD-dependent oxidoreductase n=1 Tax=Flavobacterium sp. TaxID=239 RepID=UPI003D6C6518